MKPEGFEEPTHINSYIYLIKRHKYIVRAQLVCEYNSIIHAVD